MTSFNLNYLLHRPCLCLQSCWVSTEEFFSGAGGVTYTIRYIASSFRWEDSKNLEFAYLSQGEKCEQNYLSCNTVNHRVTCNVRDCKLYSYFLLSFTLCFFDFIAWDQIVLFSCLCLLPSPGYPPQAGLEFIGFKKFSSFHLFLGRILDL